MFEPESSTYTYLVACPEHRQAVLVDPVLETFERDLEVIRTLNLDLAFTLETHVHADHLTSALKLKAITGAHISAPAKAGVECADLTVSEERPLVVGTVTLKPLFTPGHTDHHHSYFVKGSGWDAVLTGDCLLIDGCGRTDFQSGDARALFASVREKLFALPGETLVYPGHDYNGRYVSSIYQESKRNPRLGEDKSLDDFLEIMANLKLPYPKKIDFAVPGNLKCGQCPKDVPEGMEKICEPGVQG